jgi:hypothetical protein
LFSKSGLKQISKAVNTDRNIGINRAIWKDWFTDFRKSRNTGINISSNQ